MGLWSDENTPSLHRQLLLSFEPSGGSTIETFVAADNAVAVQHLQRVCNGAGAGNRQLYLWGAASVGKSHLLQAACRAVTARGGRSVWLPLAGLSSNGPAILAGLETLDLVAVDELDAVIADAAWQRALFNLINEARGRQLPAGDGGAAEPREHGVATQRPAVAV